MGNDRLIDSDRIKEIHRKKKEFDEEYTKLGMDFIRDASRELFERYSELESFGWVQYTPYFNDGNSCIFHVKYDPESIYINERGYEYYENEAWYTYFDENSSYKPKGVDAPGWYTSTEDKHTFIYSPISEDQVPWEVRAREEVGRLISALLPEDRRGWDTEHTLFKTLFGDHCKVTVTKEGFETEEYEHDEI